MDNVDRLLSIEAIRQLAYRYAWATDSRDLDTLVSLFIDDVQVGRDLRGREALRANLESQLHGIGISILNVGNHIIDFEDDDHARGIVYCRGEIQDRECWIVQAILPERREYARNRVSMPPSEAWLSYCLVSVVRKTHLEIPCIGSECKTNCPIRHRFFDLGVCSRSGWTVSSRDIVFMVRSEHQPNSLERPA